MPNHFERLGLPRRFSIDLQILERNYLSQSRELHPDYFQLGAASEQHASTQLSSQTNEAYTTLRDPLKRGQYLLSLLTPSNDPLPTLKPDQLFLMEVMEFRERVEEQHGNIKELQSLQAELEAKQLEILHELETEFAKLEPIPSPSADQLAAVRTILNRTKTLKSLARELAPEFESL